MKLKIRYKVLLFIPTIIILTLGMIVRYIQEAFMFGYEDMYKDTL